MKKLFFIGLFFYGYIMFIPNYISATIINNVANVYNMDKADNYIVYEHDKVINNKTIHYISYFSMIENRNYDIISNNGELINSDMYFPSISKDGKFIVFTSRATNITDDNILKCKDILDNTEKYCSNIFLYNVTTQKSILIKDDLAHLNGDSYIAKISGNGKSVVFETIATNNYIYDSEHSCIDNEGINRCINIFKYSTLTGRITLVSRANNGGGNANSVSPSISYDGRFISFQSNATDLVNLNNTLIDCTNVYLVDTLNSTIRVISKNGNQIFNDSSGNSKVSDNGKYVVYESYASNSGDGYNGKRHIFLYTIEDDKNIIISKKENILNNRDNYFFDISDNEMYILYRTTSTNIGGMGGELYVYNINGKKSSEVSTTCYTSENVLIDNENIFYNCNNVINSSKIDTEAPVIVENQEVFLLKDNINKIREKIIVSDNLFCNEEIELYINDMSMISDVGEYLLEINAIDKFENVSKANIKVIVLEHDVEGPVFSDTKEIKILKGSSSLNLYEYIEAIDKIDGSTRIYIIDDGNLNLDATGEYKIKLMSKDNAENISYANLNIIVYDNYNFNYFYELILIIGVLGVIIFSIIKVK